MANHHRKEILVIGLGRFGRSLVDTLIARDQRVSVVDISEAKINKIASKCEFAKVCDTRDEDTLKMLGVTNFDHVVVAIGSSIESSIITTLLLKDMGIKNLTIKVSSKQHRQAILKLGIPSTNVITPEHEAGERSAHSIACPIVADYISLEGGMYGIVELFPGNSKLTGLNIKESNIKKTYNVNIVAIKRNNQIIIPDGTTNIEQNDSLIIIGDNQSIIRFEQDISL